jgi:hypothetical protein
MSFSSEDSYQHLLCSLHTILKRWNKYLCNIARSVSTNFQTIAISAKWVRFVYKREIQEVPILILSFYGVRWRQGWYCDKKGCHVCFPFFNVLTGLLGPRFQRPACHPLSAGLGCRCRWSLFQWMEPRMRQCERCLPGGNICKYKRQIGPGPQLRQGVIKPSVRCVGHLSSPPSGAVEPGVIGRGSPETNSLYTLAPDTGSVTYSSFRHNFSLQLPKQAMFSYCFQNKSWWRVHNSFLQPQHYRLHLKGSISRVINVCSVCTLRDAGHSYDYVALILHVTANPVRYACHAERTTSKRSGRPAKLSATQTQELIYFVCSSRTNRLLSYQQLSVTLNWGVSEYAIRDALRRVGFRRYVACTKTPLSEENKGIHLMGRRTSGLEQRALIYNTMDRWNLGHQRSTYKVICCSTARQRVGSYMRAW